LYRIRNNRITAEYDKSGAAAKSLNSTPKAIKRQLAAYHRRIHDPGIFLFTESDATAIRTTYEQSGELAAAVELRRRFKGITDNEKARACVRSIVGWTPLPALPAKKVRKCSSKPAD
jgi:hypothetical protein